MQLFISFYVIFSKKCEDGHGSGPPDTKKPADAGGEGKGRVEDQSVIIVMTVLVMGRRGMVSCCKICNS